MGNCFQFSWSRTYIPTGGIAGSDGNSMFSPWRAATLVSEQMHYLTSPPAMYKCASISASSITRAIYLCNHRHPRGVDDLYKLCVCVCVCVCVCRCGVGGKAYACVHSAFNCLCLWRSEVTTRCARHSFPPHFLRQSLTDP